MLLHSYLVRQDGADFYLYDGSALVVTLHYPRAVRDFELTKAVEARQWFKNLAAQWGIVAMFEDEVKREATRRSL